MIYIRKQTHTDFRLFQPLAPDFRISFSLCSPTLKKCFLFVIFVGTKTGNEPERDKFKSLQEK